MYSNDLSKSAKRENTAAIIWLYHFQEKAELKDIWTFVCYLNSIYHIIFFFSFWPVLVINNEWKHDINLFVIMQSTSS